MRHLGIPFIISAPSGAGKTSIIETLCAATSSVAVSISHTTRPMRPGEVDGINYHFISTEAFQQYIKKNMFLEYAKVFGHYYGTSLAWIKQQLSAGIDVLLDIDWQGAQQIKKKLPQSVSIFILPPSLEALRQRLTQRAQDNENIIEKRMAEAKSELSHYREFDFLVVNQEFTTAVADCQAIIRSRHLQTEHQQQELKNLLDKLLA